MGDREGRAPPASPRHAARRRGALMLESLVRADRPATAFDATLLGALERASGAVTRLDQALDNHPLRTVLSVLAPAWASFRCEPAPVHAARMMSSAI